MKNKFQFFAIFLSIAFFGFTGCNEDDDSEGEFNASAIVGQWDVDYISTTVVTSESSNTNVEEPDIWMNFKEDGTGVTSNELSFSWSLSGSSLSLNFESPDDGADGPPVGGNPGEEFYFNFDDLAAFENLSLEVTSLEDSYMAAEYAANYGTMSVKMEMELSR